MNDLTRIRAGAFALALCLGGSAANADVLGLSRSASGESAQSVAELIARNIGLQRLSEVDPDLARLLAIRLMELTVQEGPSPEADGESDGEVDPDIDRLKRSSPEAVLDLIELMEKAARAR